MHGLVARNPRFDIFQTDGGTVAAAVGSSGAVISTGNAVNKLAPALEAAVPAIAVGRKFEGVLVSVPVNTFFNASGGTVTAKVTLYDSTASGGTYVALATGPVLTTSNLTTTTDINRYGVASVAYDLHLARKWLRARITYAFSSTASGAVAQTSAAARFVYTFLGSNRLPASGGVI